MKKHGLSIGTKIALSLVTIMLAGMFMVAIAVLKMAERDIAQQKIDSASILAHNLAYAINHMSTSAEKQTSEWRSDIQSLLNSYVSPSSFDYIALVNSDNATIAEAGAEGLDFAPLAAEAKLQTSAMKPACNFAGAEAFNLFKKNLQLSAVVPLFKDGHKWGILYARSVLDGLRQDMAQLYKLTFLYIVLDAILLFLFGCLLISKDVVRPIKRLTSLVDVIGGGDLSPFTNTARHNEIGKLYHAFERMDKRLSEQRKEINEYISSLENTNRELKKVQEEVIRSEKLASVGRLAAGVAHEIGNPLAAVIGYVELLLQGTVSKEEEQDFLSRISSELQRINGIIRDLLDFSRPSPLQIEGVSVNDVIESTLSLLSHQKVMRYINVQSLLQPDLPPAKANTQQLKQVLINILVNAVDAMPVGGDLRIRSELKKTTGNDEEQEYIVIEIEDSGTGITPEDLTKIFDPFFTTKPPGEGTGLGLAISLRIMESFGGKINVQSTIGKGTKFSLILKVWGHSAISSQP